MTKLYFTPEEEKVVRVYAGSLPNLSDRLLSWFGQVGLPLAFAAYGVVTNSIALLGAAVGGLVGVMVVRLYYQQQYADIFRRVCQKVQAHQKAEPSDT